MIGCGILGLAIYTLTNEVGVSLVNLLNTEWTVQLEGDDIHIKAFADATAVFCVVAIFVMIFCIVGCIGVCKESKDILKTYLALNVIMFIVVISATIMGNSTFINRMQGAMEKAMVLYQDNPRTPDQSDSQISITKSWNTIQRSVCKPPYLNKT